MVHTFVIDPRAHNSHACTVRVHVTPKRVACHAERPARPLPQAPVPPRPSAPGAPRPSPPGGPGRRPQPPSGRTGGRSQPGRGGYGRDPVARERRPGNFGPGRAAGPGAIGNQGRGRFRPRSAPALQDSDLVLNEMIPANDVRVLDPRKEMLGTMPLSTALERAAVENLDVILLNDTTDPPLVRICSVSKYKFEQDKAKKQAARKQRESLQELKELKLSPRTEVHDLEVRMRKATKELGKGNKVKLLVQFKGREMGTMIPIAQDLLEKIAVHCEDVGTREAEPRVQGRQMVMTLLPK